MRDIDLALHLPLRYEDETRIVRDRRRCATATTAQVEGVGHRLRASSSGRAASSSSRIADDSGDLVLRFLHFYPSHQKTLARGERVRVRGEVRGGFFGREMVHPAFKAVDADTPLPTALTPVYPSTRAAAAGLPAQGDRRRRCARADLDEHAAGRASCRRACRPCARRCVACTTRRPTSTLATLEDRSHPAWQRLKFEELLAQQLSQLQAQRERAAPARAGARAARAARCTSACSPRCRSR